MRLRTIAGWGAISSLTLAALAGCQPIDNANTTVANSNTAVVTNTAVTNTTVSSVTSDPAVTTTEAGGVKTETRAFADPNSPVERVVVTTREGKRTARVYSRKGEVKDLPEGQVERALTATGDALGDAAGFVTDKSKDAYDATKGGVEKAADKTGEFAEKAVDKTGDVAETVKDKTVSGAKAVGSKAESIGEKTVDGAKTVGEKTADGAKTVGKKTAEGAKKVGGAIKNAVTP